MFDEDLCYFSGVVEVEARRLGAKATIRADLGPVNCDCRVVVARDESGPGLEIKIEDRLAGNRRALVEEENGVVVIKIMAQHAAIKRYLGAAPEFPEQDSDCARTIIAEIIAGETTRMVMERIHPLRTEDALDAAGFYVDHQRYLSKYLRWCHRALVTAQESS